MVLRKHELEARLREDHELVRSGVLRNEHPLDLTAGFANLMQACRRGDLATSQELIAAGVNLNAKDAFDYTLDAGRQAPRRCLDEVHPAGKESTPAHAYDEGRLRTASSGPRRGACRIPRGEVGSVHMANLWAVRTSVSGQASLCGHFELVRLLLESGKSPAQRSTDWWPRR